MKRYRRRLLRRNALKTEAVLQRRQSNALESAKSTANVRCGGGVV